MDSSAWEIWLCWRDVVAPGSRLKAGIAIHPWEVLRASRTVTGGLKKKGFNATLFHSQVGLPALSNAVFSTADEWRIITICKCLRAYHVLNWSIYHLRTPLKISESHNYQNTKCHHYCSYTAYMQIPAAPWSLNSQEMKWNSFFPLSCILFPILWNKALHKTSIYLYNL